MKMTKNDLQELLKKQICEITFQKVDGTIRKISGTLMDDYLDAETKTYETNYKVNDNVLPFYDVDDEHWKSARLDSIILFSTDDHLYHWTNAENAIDPYLVVPRDVIETQRHGKDYTLLVR
jgi:hypothetical protein